MEFVKTVAVRPPSYEEHIAVEGQSYTIQCDTTVIANVRWYFTSSVTGLNWTTLYDEERIWKEFQPRFSLNTSVPGIYSLDISNVQLNDAGNYTCIDDVGPGHTHTHNLIVQCKWRLC